MCEAMTIAATTAAVASTGIGIYSGIQSGRYNARVAENNAKIASWKRADVIRQGAEQASLIRAAGRRAEGSAIAATAANGIDTTVGSGAAAIATSGVNAELDAIQAKANAARAAWGLQNQAQDLQAQARLIRRSSILGAVGQGLGGAGSALSVYNTFHPFKAK